MTLLRQFRWWGAVLLIGVATSCSGSSSDQSSATEPAVESTTPTTIDVRQAAGAHYIEIVTPHNCARDLFNFAFDGASLELEAQKFPRTAAGDEQAYQFWRSKVLVNAEKYADAKLKFASELGTYSWPEDVQTSIDELIEDMLSEASAYAAYSNLGWWQAVLDWKWPTFKDRNPAGVIRAKLGLESNVNNDTVYCEGLGG